jgi:hypothetical protein
MTNYTLSKWPRLLVWGETITPEQAKVVILKTTNWYFSSNSKNYEKTLYKLIGINSRENLYDHVSYFQAENGILDLQYLDNNWILSCWMGGPHGWCNPDGTIFSNTFNIGKWPEFEEVLEEWELIAKTFPFLKLNAQLVNNEGEDDKPEVGFILGGGKVKVYKPEQKIVPVGDCEFDLTRFLEREEDTVTYSSEAGVSLEWVKSGLELLNIL